MQELRAGENPACGLSMGWKEWSQGAGPFGTHLIQGDLNFQAHQMGNQPSQRLSGLLAGRCLLWQHSCPAAESGMWLLHRMPSCKKERLMLSKVATKKPHS